jgi:hypothetical protein
MEDLSQVSSLDIVTIRARTDRVERIRAEIVAHVSYRSLPVWSLASPGPYTLRARGKATMRELSDIADYSGKATWRGAWPL